MAVEDVPVYMIPDDINERSWNAHDYPERPFEPWYTMFCGCKACDIAMDVMMHHLMLEQ